MNTPDNIVMSEEIVRKMFSTLYPKLVVKSIQILERQQFSENEMWIQDSPAIFVGVEYDDEVNYDSIRENGNVSNRLTDLTGFEFNVFIS